MFDENSQGYIGFQKLGNEGGLYTATALQAIVEKEGLHAYAIEIANPTSGVVTFTGEKGTTMHVQFFGDSCAIVHGYGRTVTPAAKRRTTLLRNPKHNNDLDTAIEFPFFEYIGEVLGVRKATPKTMFRDTSVGILRTTGISNVEETIEAFFVDDDISVIRVNENAEMEIRGSKHILRIQQSKGTYTLFGYNQESPLTPTATQITSALSEIHVDPNPTVTFSKNLEVKVEHHIVTDYGVRVVYNAETDRYYVSPVASRKVRQPNVYIPTTQQFETKEAARTYIEEQIAEVIADEFKQGEAREVQFTGARFYSNAERTTKGYEDCLSAYQQRVAKGLCSALQIMYRDNSQKEPRMSYEDAGDRWFREQYGTEHREIKPRSIAHLIEPPEEAPQPEVATTGNRHERRAAKARRNAERQIPK